MTGPRPTVLMVKQLVRFSAVGLICLTVSTSTLAALHDLAGFYYLVAFAIAFCVGSILGYVLNGLFTFTVRVTHLGASRYILLNGFLLAINSMLMKVLVDGAHIWYIGASLLLAVVNTPMSFLLHRAFSYSLPSMLLPGRKDA